MTVILWLGVSIAFTIFVFISKNPLYAWLVTGLFFYLAAEAIWEARWFYAMWQIFNICMWSHLAMEKSQARKQQHTFFEDNPYL